MNKVTCATLLLLFLNFSTLLGNATPHRYSLSDLVQIASKQDGLYELEQENLKTTEALKSLAVKAFLPEISIKRLHSRALESGDSAITIPEQNTYKDFLSVRQPLYSDGKLVENYKQATKREELYQTMLKSLKFELTNKIKDFYYEYSKYYEIVKLFSRYDTRLKETMKKNEILYNSGKLSYLDYLKLEQTYADYEAEKEIAENYVIQLKLSIKNQLLLSEDFEINIVSPNAIPLKRDLKDYLAIASENKSEIKIAQLRKEIDEQDVKLRRPGIEVFLDYEYRWEGLSFPPEDDKEWRINLNATIPLYDFTLSGQRTKQKVEPYITNHITNVQLSLFDKTQITNTRLAKTQKLFASRYETDNQRNFLNNQSNVTRYFYETERHYNKLRLNKKQKERFNKTKEAFLVNYQAGLESEAAYFNFLLTEVKNMSGLISSLYDFQLSKVKLEGYCGKELN